MGRIVVEVILLGLIAAGLLYSARKWDTHRQSPSPANPALHAPPDAIWQVRHLGTGDQTEIVLIRRDQHTNQIWEQRRFTTIDNTDPDYDKRFYNAMEDARARAALLNSQEL